MCKTKAKMQEILMIKRKIVGTCGLSVTTFFHQVLNYYYLTVYIMFKPKMSLWDLPKTEEECLRLTLTLTLTQWLG